MYIRRIYPIMGMMKWTRWETMLFFVIALIPTILFEVFELTWLQIPWTPIALVGTALAFVIGFQNNAAYGRIWEARKIWGGIVNTSRTWGMKVKAMVTNEYNTNLVSEEVLKKEIKTLTYRHIAWMTALRHAMRQKKPWEVFMNHKSNREYEGQMNIPERFNTLEDELKSYLSDKERKYVLSKGNKQTALLNLQSDHLKSLKEKGLIWEFSFLELENVLEELFTLQGKSERIKNFPYPRQYATIGHYFVWVFILLLPFGIIPEFDKIGHKLVSDFPLIGQYFIWAAIPFSVIVSWIFHTMERIGRAGENPFEGTANDVPISTISRGIEIDLRQMLDENHDEIPKQYPVMWDAQM
jgi:putative membrane protein